MAAAAKTAIAVAAVAASGDTAVAAVGACGGCGWRRQVRVLVVEEVEPVEADGGLVCQMLLLEVALEMNEGVEATSAQATRVRSLVQVAQHEMGAQAEVGAMRRLAVRTPDRLLLLRFVVVVVVVVLELAVNDLIGPIAQLDATYRAVVLGVEQVEHADEVLAAALAARFVRFHLIFYQFFFLFFSNRNCKGSKINMR